MALGIIIFDGRAPQLRRARANPARNGGRSGAAAAAAGHDVRGQFREEEKILLQEKSQDEAITGRRARLAAISGVSGGGAAAQ